LSAFNRQQNAATIFGRLLPNLMRRWKPLCERRLHTRLAHLAPDRIAGRRSARLSAHRLARFHVWVFAIGRSRLLELAPHTSGFKIVFETMVRAREIQNVIWHRAAIFFPLAARARSTSPSQREECDIGNHRRRRKAPEVKMTRGARLHF
jgi:hypothetical protein